MGQNTYNANNTWTCPVGVTAVKVEIWAPGGGGAGSNNNLHGSAGGKGGAFAQGNTVAVTAGATYTVRVPAGGAGGGNNANGTAGANAFFALASNNQVLVNAEGGGGATRGVPANTTAGGAANNSTGDVTYNGGAGYGGGNTVQPGGGGGGAAGNNGNGTASANQTGGAAAGGGGAGGNGGNNNTAGNAATAPGGGGGGGGNRTSGTKTGGAGGAGRIILTWTDPPLPTLDTDAASSVAATTATGNGNITQVTGGNATNRGFVWDTGTHADPGNVALASSGYAGSSTESGSFGTGAYTGSLTSLVPVTLYYVRAWCQNPIGYAYGDEHSFTTLNWPIRLKLSSNIAASAATDTTEQLTADGTFQAGKISDDTNPLSSIDVLSDRKIEFEWCLEATAAAATSDVYQFRITKAGTPIDTYTVTPQWTIGSGGAATSILRQMLLHHGA